MPWQASEPQLLRLQLGINSSECLLVQVFFSALSLRRKGAILHPLSQDSNLVLAS
jgi:hypothetical protein